MRGGVSIAGVQFIERRVPRCCVWSARNEDVLCNILLGSRGQSVYERVTLSMVLSVERGEQYRCITKTVVCKDTSVQWLCLGEASRGLLLHWVSRRTG